MKKNDNDILKEEIEQEDVDTTEEVEETEEKETEKKTDENDAKPEEKEEATEETKEEKLQKELDEQKDMLLRLTAEYDNFRKRSAREALELRKTVIGETVNEILPVFDNFERALETETTDEKYKSGVSMIFNQFSDMLTKLGIEIINPLGETFDPNIANAVNQIEDEKYGENEVVQVFQKGYKIGDKVIRYAMVVVANP